MGVEVRELGPATALQSIDLWAIELALELQAIHRCPHHGYFLDRTDPDAWRRAELAASQYPHPASTVTQSLRALEELRRSVGDTCPDCD